MSFTNVYAVHYAASTIISAVSAITYSHKIVGLPDPADNFYIKKLVGGCSQTVQFGRLKVLSSCSLSL